jgi:hypothetical protein
MNDNTTATALRHRLNEVRDAMSDVHMTVPHSAIFSRATNRRTRRGLAAAVTAACAALGLALGLVLPGGAARAVHVHLAAWSVDTNSNGTVTFKLRNTAHPARLQRVLAEAGVPAMVRSGKICLAQGRHVLLPTKGIVSYINGRPARLSSVFLMAGGGGRQNDLLNWSWTITPSKIPSHAHFVISVIPGHQVPANRIQAAWEFVPQRAQVRCATFVKY